MLFRTRALATLTAAALVAPTGGCIMHGRAKALAYVADGAMIVTGGILLRKAEATCSNPLDHCPAPDYDTRTLDLMGGTLIAAGAIGLALQLSNDLQPEAAPQYAEPEVIHHDSLDVRVLTADAKQSAQAGACADVRNLGHRVAAIDPVYYRNVFRQDADIRFCIE